MKKTPPSFEFVAAACGFDMIELKPHLIEQFKARAEAEGIPLCLYLGRIVEQEIEHMQNGFE